VRSGARLKQFDKNSIATPKERARYASHVATPRPAVAREPAMPRMRHLIAASLVCLLGWTSTLLYLGIHRTVWFPDRLRCEL